MSSLKLEDFPVGTKCDCRDAETWRTATVLKIHEEDQKIYISFDGWASEWDTWKSLTAVPAEVAPLWAKVEQGTYTGDPDLRNKYVLDENLEEYKTEMDILKKIRKVLREATPVKITKAEDFGKAIDEKVATWLAKGGYVDKMLCATVTRKTVYLPFKYLDLYIETLVAGLKLGMKKELEEKILIQLHAILTKKIGPNETAYLMLADEALSEIEPKGKFALMESKNPPSHQPDEKAPSSRVLFINTFGVCGGFEYIKSRFDAIREDFTEGRRSKKLMGLSFISTQYISATLRYMKYILDTEFMFKYFESLKVDASEFIGGVLLSFNRDQIYGVADPKKKKALYDDFLSILGSIIRGASKGGKHRAAQFEETAQLDLILFFLRAPMIVAQRRGMNLINLFIKAIDPKKWQVGDKVYGQFGNKSFYPGRITEINADGTYNVLYNDGDTSDHLKDHQIKAPMSMEGGYRMQEVEDPPVLEYIDKEYLIRWLEENKVIDQIATDSRLFQHSTPIFKLLSKENQLKTAHLDILFAQAKTEEGAVLLSQLAEEMDEKTLSAMYKRQTEDLDYADYQPWQLDALTKFSLSAIKATKGKNYFALNLFWDFLRPENEKKLDKSIIMKATKCLNTLLESPLLSATKDKFFNMCTESLKGDSGEVNALAMFQVLVKGMSAAETSEKITESLKKYDLLRHVIKNSVRYNDAASKKFQELEAKGKVDVKDAILTGASTHGQQLAARLQFFQFTGQNSAWTMSPEVLDFLWKLYVTNSVSSFDTEFFMTWLSGVMSSDAKGYDEALSEDARIELFKKLSVTPHIHIKTKKPIAVGTAWQRCFTATFLNFNRSEGALDTKPLMVYEHSRLKGMDQLWKFALGKQADKHVQISAQAFLGSMYIKVMHKKLKSRNEVIDSQQDFVDRIMGALYKSKKSNNDEEIISTLKLLNSVLYRLKTGEMIKRPLFQVGEKIKAHWKSTRGALYGCVVHAINEDGTYHLKFNDGDVDDAAPEILLVEENEKRRVPKPVKLEIVEQHVQNAIAGEQKYFNLVFGCLDKGGEVSALAWNTLEILPPSMEMATRLRNLANAKEIDWPTIFPTAPVKLLYTLRILDPLKMTSSSADTKAPSHPLSIPAVAELLAKDGLKKLLSILSSCQKDLISDNLSNMSLAKIYDILTWFLGSGYDGELKAESLLISSLDTLTLLLGTDSNEASKDVNKPLGKAMAVASMLKFITVYVSKIPSAYKVLVSYGKKWEKMVVSALITCKEIAVQKAFADGMQVLCRDMKTPETKSTIDSKGKMELQDKLLSVVNEHFAELDTQSKECAQYLLFMRMLLSNASVIDPKSGGKICNSLALLIRKHPMNEVSPKTQDSVLGALLTLTAEVIKKVPSLRDTMGVKGEEKVSLLKPVFDMLFMVPTLENSYHLKVRPPQCKHMITRRAGFDLLEALATGHEENFSALADMLVPYHLQIHSGGMKPNGWEFEPAWKVDEQEREGYCGLVNLGNTCFANAALQQVFMQPQLRSGILAIDNYAHPNPSRPDWKKDELAKLQWLLGNLQESQKRAIDPMQFFNNFEDVDWENTGKPLRGEGSASHAQEDSNGFLQVLLDRVQDRIKKTSCGSVISDVCGCEMSEQIVGSRTAPYINYSYRTNKWTGSISLNVDGKKNLLEALKAHVEWQSRTRKVTNEGAFGQIYKKNVPVFVRSVFKTLPDCLMICLNRMGYDNMGNTIKLNHLISFPMDLNMKPYSSESLFGKLPRGSDTGEKPEIKAKIEKPDVHPDEYYQYKLMGVIVHAGRTLQSGHYYSYIRERPPSNKWYCFDDSSISEFDVNKLGEETFGSSENSWKSSTAYVLVYDRVTIKKKEVKVETKKPEKKAVIPTGMLRRIWEENATKWHDTNVHDINYGISLLHMIETYAKTAKPLAVQPKIEDVSATPSSFMDKVTRLGTRYLFMTLARSKSRQQKGFNKWIGLIKGLYKDNVASSVWLLSMFTNPKVDWFKMLLMAKHENTYAPVQEVRFGAVEVISEALRTIYGYEIRHFVKAASKPALKKRYRNLTPQRTTDEKREGKEKKVAETKGESPLDVKEEILKADKDGYSLPIIERLLEELFSTGQSANQFHWIRLLSAFSKFPDKNKTVVAYLKQQNVLEDMINLATQDEKEAYTSGYSWDVSSDQLPDEYFSLIANLLSSSDDFKFISKPYFICRLLQEPFNRSRAAPVCELLAAIVMRDTEKSIDLIVQALKMAVTKTNHEQTRPYYRCITHLLTVLKGKPKSFLAIRVISVLLGAFTADTKFKEGDFIAEHIVRLCSKFEECLKAAKSESLLKAIQFLSESPGEKKPTFNIGDDVVAIFKSQQGVYPGTIHADNGDGTYHIIYDDNDVWEKAPAEKIRLRLFPKVFTEKMEELEKEGLDPQTVKCLQFYLNSFCQQEDEKLQLTGKMDESTVKRFLHAMLRIRISNGKLDHDAIWQLQRQLDGDAEKSEGRQNYPFEDGLLPTSEDGRIGPITKFYFRAYLDKQITELSRQEARNEFKGGGAGKFELPRRAIGFHASNRRYTVTSMYAPYARSTADKVKDLKSIYSGDFKADASYDYDSDDERAKREFKAGQRIDFWDEKYRMWREGMVDQVVGDSVVVTRELRHLEYFTPARRSYWSYMQAQLRKKSYHVSDPSIIPEARLYSFIRSWTPDPEAHRVNLLKQPAVEIAMGQPVTAESATETRATATPMVGPQPYNAGQYAAFEDRNDDTNWPEMMALD